MLTNQSNVALVQLLQSLSADAIRLLFLKHLNESRVDTTSHTLLTLVNYATPDQLVGLLAELLTDRTAIRTDAPTKYVFDARRDELRRCLRADGFAILDGGLTRLVPAAEPTALIADQLEQTLADSGLDSDDEIRRMLQDSHVSMSGLPPDFNDATTKARIALETVARRSAANIAEHRGIAPPADRWGSSLALLRAEGVICTVEEEALAKIYTLISPGTHVPKGLTDEQWALLARTFALSAAYFLVHQHIAAHRELQ